MHVMHHAPRAAKHDRSAWAMSVDEAGAAFVLGDQLLRLQEGQLEVDNELSLESEDTDAQRAAVTRLVDATATEPTSVQEPDVYALLLSCIKHVASLPPDGAQRLLDTVLSGLDALLDDIHAADPADVASWTEPLERYAFALQWLIAQLERHRNKYASQDKSKARRGAAARRQSGDASWSWADALPRVLGVLAKTLRIVSDRMWYSAALRDTFVSRCVLRPTTLLWENEAYMKLPAVKQGLLAVPCWAVKQHAQSFHVQTSILQSLQYYEHLAEPMAELLQLLRVEFDVERLGEDVLRDLAGKAFTSLDAKSPRSFGRFLVRMAELNPRSVLKQMSLLQRQLDSESYPMRMAMVEVHGRLIKELCLSDEFAAGAEDAEPDDGAPDDDTEAPRTATQKQVDVFFEQLLERFLDLTTFVRAKVVQVCTVLCELPTKFPQQRLKMATLAVRALEDKSSHVRRYSIALLVKLMLTHPYGAMHGGDLHSERWTERQAVVDAELAKAEEALTWPVTDATDAPDAPDAPAAPDAPSDGLKAPRAPRRSELDVAALAATQQAMSREQQAQLLQLRLTAQYHRDALQFIHVLEKGVPILIQLLASTNKAEVLESMEFFRVAHEYELRGAADGVRAMVHLIWAKDHALVMEDGSQLKGIRSRLIEVYRSIYFDAYPELGAAENVARISRNMIERTFGATLAELTSLEQLLSVMHAEGLVDAAVIDMLWDVYASPKPIAKAQRRGAIMILSMLAKAERGMVAGKMDVLLQVGLGPLGTRDLVLAQHTCLAMQRSAGSAKKVKGALSDTNVRYPMQHPMFARLRTALELGPEQIDCDAAWFGLAEHAIDAVYQLGEQPESLCTDLLRHLTEHALQGSGDAAHDTFRVAQWVFAIGHIALKQTVYLELVERECKRRKAARAAPPPGEAAKPTSELDQVAEQADDDIGEMIALIRDHGLLHGDDGLLALYGPLVVSIASNPKTYADPLLQRAAALTLAKFMCISSEFCEANLGLLLHLLRSSADSVVRANAVIGLGDVAVCFGTLVDENSGRLYAGLSDPDLGVKKNTLMVLTHLILNGMIKVKGQLGELAKCLEDSEPRVSDLAKLFFSELAQKENAVYNNLPDIISHLSSGEHAVDEATFTHTMRFIFTFIDKERQAENIIEKLCQRFRLTTEERQWRDIAFCLSLLSYRSERSIRKLIEGLPLYQDKLYVPEIYQRFSEILQKMHQGKSAAAAKTGDADLREFEDVLAQAAAHGTQQNELEGAAQAHVADAERRRARPPPRTRRAAA